VYAIIRSAGAFGRCASDEIGAFFERAAVERHEPEPSAYFQHFLDAWMIEQVAQIHDAVMNWLSTLSESRDNPEFGSF
jgi:trans-2-enoyl-CoA reductase